MKFPHIEVKLGQLWKDNDPRRNRDEDRLLEVTALFTPAGTNRPTQVELRDVDGRTRLVKIDRFRGQRSGYALVQDVVIDCEVESVEIPAYT